MIKEFSFYYVWQTTFFSYKILCAGKVKFFLSDLVEFCDCCEIEVSFIALIFRDRLTSLKELFPLDI